MRGTVISSNVQNNQKPKYDDDDDDDDMMFTILSKTICLFQRYIVSTFILISMYTIAVERTGISTYWVSFILITY